VIRAYDGTQESSNSNEASAVPVGDIVSATNSTIAATSPVYADGLSLSTVTVTIRDSSNNPVAGATVTLSSSRGATDTINQPAGTTNGSGEITGTVRSSTPGDSVISAVANGTINLVNTATINFYNTPTGSNVAVSPISSTQVTFTTVTGVGTTSAQENPIGTPLPSGYITPVYYDISTTATYTGTVAICITYDEAKYLGNESRVKLLHYETGTWVNRTSGAVDTVNNKVCGNVTSFSEFATAEATVPTITTSSLPDGTVGAPYSATLTTSGGVPPLTWSILTGSLPAGLTLNASTGVISGTPTIAGTSNFTVRVTDSNNETNDKALSIMIYSAVSITTSSLPDGTVGVAYNRTVSATGGKTPYNWSIISGGLPTGLSLNASTGVISGTPSATGTYNFTIQVQDANSALATQALSIAIYDPLSITTIALADGTVNVAYSQTLTASGGKTPYTWSIASGSLPAGLALGAGTGVISGTPTATGASNFTVQVTDASGQIASRALSITIYSGVAITTASLPDGTVGLAYNATLTATGGATPYTWSITVGTLPPGLSLNSSTGVISGTPTAAGSYPITVQVTDNNLVTNTRDLSIIIYGAVSVATSTLSDGTVNAIYSETLTASGGKTPYTWGITAGTLPSGLSLNTTTGVISGTPSASGTSNFTVQVTDANGATASRALSITIFSAVSITTTSLPDGTVNLAYSQTLVVSGGKTPYTWSIISGTLPAGLSLNSSTGAITGTPTASGASTFTAQVTDANGAKDTRALTITIYAALTISTLSLSDGTVGANYSSTVNVTGGKNPIVWGLSSGALPTGLSLNSSTGAISGTPTASGIFDFSIQVTDANGAVATQAYTVTIYAPLSVTTTGLSDGTVNAYYSQTLAVSGGKSPFTWTLSGGALPAGLTLAGGTGVISGTPTVAGTSNFTVQVTDANGATASQALSITIYPALSITTSSLADGTVGLAYSQTLTSSGGKSPLTWSIAAGALPAGLSLAGATGVISGTPTVAGTSNFTVQVVDANGAVASKALSIVIYSALSVTTTSLSDGTVGVAYSQTVSASGGKTPYTWSVPSGSLPAGLTLNGGTGVISGTPTVAGTSNFTIRATDANGAMADQALSIAVYDPLSVTTTALAAGTIGVAYSQTLTAAGGKTPYTWGVIAGTLPTGLSLAGATGVISGTPTATGTWNFTVQAADSGGRTASQALSITIYSGLTITTAALPDGTVTAAYSATLSASGGQSPYTWAITVGSLPPGLSLAGATGVISGTPTVAGSYPITVQVTDSNLSTQTKDLTITIYGAVSVTTAALSDGTVNAAYSQTLAAGGGKPPYTWGITLGSLPTGLVLNGVTGVISGTPSASGTYNFTVQVTDANGAVASQALSILIYSAISVTTTALSDGTVGAAYSHGLSASGGKTPYTWSIAMGTLPAGLTLNATTGVISGTPTTAGTSNFTVQATDANGAVATRSLSIVIYGALSVTTTALPDGMVGSSYSQMLSAAGGKTPYAWSLSAGSLPAGLGLNSSTGAISGTPATAGTSNFTVQVTDANGAVAVQALSITVYDTLTITTSSLADGTVDLAYSQTLTAGGGKAPLLWSIVMGVLPAGLSLNGATGVIGGTPTTAGTSNITVRVTDSNGFISDRAFSITVYGAISIGTTALPDGTVNGSYSATLAASGGKTPYSWSITAGTLPAGLTLDSSTGVIGGVPTTAGTSNFTVQVTDANGAGASRALSITIYSALSIGTTSLSDGTVSLSYTQTLSAAGGKTPYTWGIATGSLPAGLSLNTATGVIGGTPTTAGTSSFTVRVTDANGAFVDQALSITVYAALSITTTVLSDGTVGLSYSQALASSGGKPPITWAITAGGLPAGLSLDTSTGVISGTPTTAGTSNFTVRATDANGATATQALSITIYSGLSVTTASLSQATVSVAYSQTLTAAGGKMPYTWSITLGTLPAGLSLNGTTGVISGMPTTAGTSNFTVQVTDANGATNTKALSIVVNPYPAITTTSLSDGTVNLAYSQTLISTGGTLPIVWSIPLGTLPTGLSLNASTGAIGGTPTTAGTSNFTVRATDANGATVDQALSITIYPALSITTSSLADGTVNLAYSQTLTAGGGKTPYTWGILSGALPAGLSLNVSTGVISGTPTTAGTSNFTVQVTDANGATASKALAITVYGGVSVTTTSLAEGNVGSVYTQTLTASGGKTPYTWSITSGVLPAGLSLTGSTGAISGTPTVAGTSDFTVQVTDANGATATRALSITIYNTLTVTTSTLSEGTVSASYTQTLAASGGKTPYTWSLVSGSLPAGLILTASTGEISGTPTASGTFGFTVRVTDSNGFTNDRLLSINIYGAVSVTTSSLPDGTIGANYATTLAATGGKVPYVWSVTAGTFPDGLSLNVVTGDITGIPTVAGLFSFTVRVQDVHGATATKDLSINVYGSLSVTTTSLSDGTVNASYSAPLSAAGGKTPYTWSVTAGSLPAGLTLAGGTGVISGTPTVAGTSNFTVQVTDANGATASQALSITIYPALSITTSSLADGTVGLAYSQTLTSSGGKSPLTWSIAAGALPAGLSLAGATGVISGTPTVAGTSNFTVQVVDANGAVASKALSIVIYSALSVTTTSLSDGTVGVAYSQTVSASGGKTPYTWSVPSGSLPAGLTLNGGTGVISGTPTVAGTSNFTIRATDANGAMADQALSIAVYDPLSVTTTALAAGTIGVAYSQTLTAAGGKTPYTWGVIAGTLPTGLSLAGATGVISGTPTATGTWNFTVQAADSGGRTASQALSITIYSGLTITTAALPDGTVTAAYSATLSASGGQSPYTWAITVGSLPPGLSLAGATGVISGTPTVAGSYPITVQVTDSNLSTQTKDLTITIYGAVSVTTAALSDGTVNAAYSQTLAAGGGKPPYTWGITLGSLPTGLVLNGVTGVISGTPSASGTYNFTVQVTDANGAVASQALSILIYSAISVTTTALSDGTVGAAYSHGLSASGGKTPYTWSIAMGTLPAGLTLNATTGVISGTPTTAGTSNFTVQATDANGAVATRSLSIVIYGALSVTTTALPDGMVGSSYSQMLSAAGGKTPYAWSLSAGSLPAGLGLNSSTGAISGTPATAGTSNFTVQVTDANGAVAVQALSITVYDTLTITTSSLADGTVDLAYSQTLTAGGGKAPLLWSIVMGVLPAGLSLNGATGVIGGTPTTAGTSNITVRVTDSNGFISDRAFSITVYGAISIGTTALPDGTVNGSYSATLAASGGKTPYSWSITAGTLPAGLTLDSSTGVIGGVPTTAGTSNFTVQVTDANGAGASRALSITIYSALSIGTTSLSDGTVSLSYTQTLSAAGGKTPYTWGIATGSLPAGLSLNTATGVIGGTPTTAGTSSFTVRVTDANGAFVDQALSITVYAALSITTTVLSDGTVGLSYSQALASSGGKPPITWAITAGGLPAGLSLDTSTGVISGTPTTAGTSNFTVRATDANGATATQALSITIYASLSITTSTLQDGTVNFAYSQTLTAGGGKPPLSWAVAVGALPPGLTLDGSTGVISGTPTTAGTSNFTVQVTDANGATATRALSITIYSAITFVTTSLNNGTVGAAYSQTMTASGGKTPYTWRITAGALPPGLALNTSTGEISGTPTTAGSYNFTAQVVDANGAPASNTLSIVISPGLSITTSSLSDGTVNLAYSQTIAVSGGNSPYTWGIIVGSLPAGLTLNSSTGLISGTPTTAGTYNFTVQVTDANSAVATRSLSITIYGALTITTTSFPAGTRTAVYSQTVAASGGKTPYAWSVATGVLPAGLTLNSSTGVISGTPTTAGISNFTIQVSDANGATDSRGFSITINEVPTIITATLSGGTAGTSYSQTLTSAGGTPPLTWSLTLGSLPAGLTLNASTGVISGTPTVAGTYNFTITLTDAYSVSASRSYSIDIAPGVPAKANIVASKTSIVANGTDSATLTITIRDAHDNLVADGTTVTVTTTRGTVTGVTTTVNGVVSRTITSTVSGTALLGVESPTGTVLSTVTGDTSLSFIPGPPAQANIAASKTTVVADGIDQTVLTITVRDANGNLVSDGTTVTLTTTLGTVTGSGNTINGVVTRYLSSITAGTATLGVQSPTGTTLASVAGNTSITFSSGAPARAVIAASATTLVANGVDSSTLTVTVYDANNNLVTDGTSVTVTTTLGTVAGTGTTVNGVVTRTITSTISGTAMLGVQSPAGTTLTNVTGNTTILFNPGPPAQADISASKTTIIADGIDSTTLTITVRDATGNLVADGTTVRLTTTLGTVTGSGATAAGVVTRVLSGTVSGTAILGVESPAGTSLATVTGNTAIVLQPGPPAGTITLTPSPASIVADGVSTSTVTSGMIRDAYNNPVMDGTLITVAVDRGSIVTPDASSIYPGIQVTTSGGVISFVIQSSTVIGTANITALSVGGSASGSTQIVFVAGAPSPITSSITATSPVYSDGISASTVTITVRDAYNNPVSGASVTLSSSRGALDTIVQPAGVTNAMGQIVGTVASTSTGDTVITATVNGSAVLTQTATINFYNTKTGSNITVSAGGGTSVTFDMVITIGITTSTPSGSGTPLPPGYTTPVYFDISTTATFSGTVTVCITYNEATYGIREGLVKILHNEGGVLVDRTTSINTVTNTVCGVVTSFSEFATAATTATNLQITTAPQTVTAGSVSNVVMVEAKDDYGATDTGYSGTANVSSNSPTLYLDTNPAGSFTGTTIAVNMVNGVGNFYFRDTTRGTPTITVTDAAGVLTPASQKETISPAAPSGTIALMPSPAGIVADGMTTSTVTSGVITDAYGNTVSDGTLITVSTDMGSIATADASGAYAGIQVATVNGVISFIVRSGTVSGTANVTAASVEGSAVGNTQIVFLPGLPSGTIALTPSPAGIVADGMTTSTVTSGVITDAYGNTVSDGTLITVSTDMGSIATADASGAYAGIQVATVNGVISFIVRSGTVSGTANVTAASVEGSAVGNTQIVFLPGLPSGTIALTPSPAGIVADGMTTSTVTSGIITDINGNPVSDGTLITVATDLGTITTADASGAYAGIQVATAGGVITFVVRSSTTAGTANVTAASVEGGASGSTQITFLPGLPYGTIVLTPNPAIIPADGASTSEVTSGIITDYYGNTVLDGTLITVSTDKGTITTPDASGAYIGRQVATTGGVITFTVQAGTTEGTANVAATSVGGSASGQATITFTNVPPELNFPTETGYGSGDAIEPNSGIRSTQYRYKIVYRDVNNNPPSYMRICIDANPCTAMVLDVAAVDPALRDGDYSNGEQYVYAISTLSSGDHVYYFETSDGLAYTKQPSTGSLSGPHVNYPPELSYSAEAGYVTDGVDPDSGNTTVTFNFKVVYRDLDNQPPASIRACIDGNCYAMAVDSAASATLHDGDYSNGEQYVYSTLLADGTHNYYFDTTDGLEGATLPASGNLIGPIVTNTYTPVGTNVVVTPDIAVTITFAQVTASGDTYVTRSQTGSALPSGFLHGNPPAYFDIWTTATYTGKVRICYTYDDAQYFGVGYGGERGLRWLHYENGAFRDRTVTLDVNNNIVCGEVYSFSEFSAAVEEATLVTLTSFRAAGMDGKVLLTWTTASEVDSIGFNILRSTSANGPFTRINDWLIRSRGTPTRGMTYSFEDIDVENGTTYFYKLENVDINGRIAAHMIASATPEAPRVSEEKPQTGGAVGPESEETTRSTTGRGEVKAKGGMDTLPSSGVVLKEGTPAAVGEAAVEPPSGTTAPEPGVMEEEISGEALDRGIRGGEAGEIGIRAEGEGSSRRPETPETKAPGERDLPKGFTLKIEDDEGNEMEVRPPEEGETPEEPFGIRAEEDGKITLKWLARGNLKGFNILRGEGRDRGYKKINTLPIPFFASQAGDKGLIYSFRDAGTGRDKLYRYKIETILPDNTRKESGAVEISTSSMKSPEKPVAEPPAERGDSPKRGIE